MNLQHAIDILDDLIGFDTTSCFSNLAIISFIENHLTKIGIPYELTFNSDKTKANLFATIGDESLPGLVLSGHTDVVPVTGQNWSSDPFILRKADGKLFGRGSCDMKGFIAVCLSMAQSFKDAKLNIPLHFAFSYDEEIGCLGVRDLISDLDARPVKPLACIVGEPTNMQIVNAHKGLTDTRCTITGCAGHSSLPDQGVNAIVVASELIRQLQMMSEDIKKNGPFDSRFNPPFTTIHVGKINGGTAVNIIPEHCTFQFDVRNIPAQKAQDLIDQASRYGGNNLLPDMHKISKNCAIDWQCQAQFPGLDTPENEAIIDWTNRTLAQPSEISAVSYGTEAGLFSQIDIPTIVCGPGSIEQAHRADEYVEVEQLNICLEFMQSLISNLQDINLSST